MIVLTSGIDSPKSESRQDGQHLPTLVVEFGVPHEVDVGVPDRRTFCEDKGKCSEQWVDLIILCDHDVERQEGVRRP